MAIHILWPWEFPKRLTGTVIVVDVYAATTNIASFLGRGAGKLFIVNEKSVALAKQRFEREKPLVIGENLELPSDFFDFPNQPYRHVGLDVSGRLILYMTNNGTRAIELAFTKGASQVITGAFVNLQSLVSWLKARVQGRIILLPAGDVGSEDPRVAEDSILAECIRELLLGRPVHWEERFAALRSFMYAHYNPRHTELDLPIILELNRYPVVPICRPVEPGLISVTDVQKDR